ncbi:ATP dependent DNA ligase domain-containing protein [Kibdelosporangium aridum]|uniref:ATP dependent DNA ligase domain-containing protein n=1 Tax=Kibdelosporangium aridum TaxID=2030 RepID=A0A1W2G048_KIBAR|nr:ATP dependent DNA ligase domain-containing protein [Kibdelosporangium aridum]
MLDDALDGRAAVLDGEIVVYNQAAHVDFGLLQDRRGRYQRHRKSDRADQPFDDLPVRYLAFDLLQLGDAVLLNQPYDQRRALLRQILMPNPYLLSIVPAVTFEELTADRLTPQNLLERIAAEGHEGLIAKIVAPPMSRADERTPGSSMPIATARPCTRRRQGRTGQQAGRRPRQDSNLRSRLRRDR